MFVFRVILVCIFPQLDQIRSDTPYFFILSPNVRKCGRTRITPNMDTFYVVFALSIKWGNWLKMGLFNLALSQSYGKTRSNYSSRLFGIVAKFRFCYRVNSITFNRGNIFWVKFVLNLGMTTTGSTKLVNHYTFFIL